MTNEKSDNRGTAYVFMGEHVHEQRKAVGRRTLLATLRPGEAPLGSLSVEEQRWLETALTNLIRIDRARRAENASGSAYCIFEAGLAYVQCLARSGDTLLRCEAVSETYVPSIAVILTQEKQHRLVREFGFVAPGHIGNFSQQVDIRVNADLAYVARMAFRALRDVYDVKDFSATRFKVSLPRPAAPA